MAKLMKRLLIICLVVLVVGTISMSGFVRATTPEEEPVCYKQGDVSPDDQVTKDDAIYLLYATIPMFKDAYLLNQDCDFDADGVVDRNDALYLLYASIPQLAQDYPLAERVHNYHTPVWQWNEAAGSAEVQFLCGCGQTHTEAATVARQNEQAPTCTTAGSVELKGTLTFDGKDYESTKLVTLPATGNHRLDATPSCTVSAACQDCDYEVVAPGHKLVLQANGSTAASCTAAGTEHYECANDGCTYFEDVALEQLPHTLSYLENQDLANGCTYTKRYYCEGCHSVFSGTAPGDTYTKHTYTTKLTREVTCSQDGEKQVICTACGDVKETQTIPMDAEKHKWDAGVENQEGTKITYTCIGGNCGQTRVEVIAADGKVQTSALDTNTGVSLGNNTSLTMDQAMLDGLREENKQEIQIKVEPKSKDQIGLDSEKQAQIPSDVVYDFSMTDGNNNAVDFTGNVTISLPYTLEAGDDIDSIDIWYINDEGEAERVNGTYSNGFVTFTTNHFSYYTVTRLTPAERCARLGAHIEVEVQKAATCTEEGYWMKVCQRCGAVVEKEVYNKLSHDYQDTTVPNTCTEAGSVTQVCQRTGCGHTVNKVLPAKGHDMERDAQASVDATCANPGKLVMVCANGCGHTTEEATKQLEHNHVKDPAQSKAATCTAGGYDLMVCGCGDTLKTNETLPLGHDYQAEWKWAEDGLSAEVTLTCANKDCTASKILNNPVITKDEQQSQNATCLGSGAAVYLGTISYNSKTYDSKKEVTVQAPGHKPDSQLQTSATQHYYVCTVCQEKVNVENHAFDDGTVTKAPTCVDAGTKHMTCQVCDYQKEQTLAATGEHSYVNGVCSVCGFAENDCRHVKVYPTPVDVSGYDICDGLKLTHYSCACGQNQYTLYDDCGCRFGEWEETEDKDENGQTVYTYTSACLDCGLVEVDRTYSVIDTENCTRTYINGVEFQVGGQTIGKAEMTMHESSHPGITVVKTVELTQAEHGLCGQILEFKVCPCGERTTVSSSGESKCQWSYEWDPESDGETYVCYTCGATQTVSWEEGESDDPCKEATVETWTYYNKAGAVVYTVTEEYFYDAHNYEVADTELLGDSCTDGIMIYYRCSECGHTDEEFSRYHETLNEEIIDISGAGICADQLVQATCLCDAQFKDCYLRSSTGNGCELRWHYDDQTGTEYRACINCGVRVDEKAVYGEKGEDCLCMVEVTRTYTTRQGQVIGTGTYRYDTTKHNFKEEYTLVEGAQSCEDGVIRRQYCTDCDYDDTYTLEYHESYEQRVYDLTEYDSCYTALRIRGCACGQEVWINWEGMGCNWMHLEGSENSYTQKCVDCGLIYKETETRTATDDPCLTHVVRVVEISKEGKPTLTFSYERDQFNHDSVYTLTLNPGATDCNGGYTVTERCQRCGYTSTWENGGHSTYTLQNEVVAAEGLCSAVRLVKTGCACGKYGGTRLQWEGQSCRFDNGIYSKQDKTWTYTCIDCGGIRVTSSAETPVEGQQCQVMSVEHSVYKDKTGNELFSFDSTRTYTAHDDIYTFEGESCATGYYLIASCRKCGRVQREDYLYTNCGYWTTAKETLYSDDRICGEIVLYSEGCLCGNNNSTYVASDCRFEHAGYEAQTGREIRECTVCGLRMIGSLKRQSRPNSCVVDVTANYSLMLGEEALGTIEAAYTTRSHMLVTQYALNGESCSDGYTISKKCCYCDKTEYWADTYYDHEIRTVGYYRLADYGACGGELYLYSCACGQETSQGWSEGCNWKFTGVTDDEGLRESYCKTCRLYRYEGETGQKTGCYYEGTVRFKLVKDGQAVLDVTALDKEYRHSSQVLDVSLEMPGTTCENGVVVTYGCSECGHVSYGHASHHYEYTVKTVDLSQLGSSCGGYIYQRGCACGYFSNYDLDLKCDMEQKRKEQGDELNGSEQIIRTCEDCGLVVESNKAWTVDESTCMKQYTGVVTAILGSSQEEVEIRYNETAHDYGPETIVLQEGAKSCTDGIYTSATCKRCQYVYNDTWGYHRTYAAETIDLAQLGATCGGSLVRYTCACGQENRLDVSADTKCQLDQQRTDLWIEDVIDDWQYGSDGHRWFESQAYTLTCAVTEAACKLQLRVAEYWLVEDCVIREYQTWQYFDAAADQWKDIITIDTGYAYGYHDYTQTVVDTTEDGVKVTGTKYDCACGSYYYDLEYVNANGTKKRVMTGMDTTGENIYRIREQVLEYNYLYDGNCFITLSRDEYQHNSGSAGWYQDAYTYDLENPCNRTRIYTNSNHNEEQYLEEHFYTNTHWEIMTGYTCTQPGAQAWTETCMICDKVVDTGTARWEPLGHDFYSGVCTRCGLESVNGASGNIVLEDMTGEYGGDTSYVVGYWSKKDESFINTVSVILEGAPEGSDELYLEGISFASWTVASQGVRAVAVDRALVDQLAAQAVADAGHTGGYAIRLNFTTIDGVLMTYAITLDSVTAE